MYQHSLQAIDGDLVQHVLQKLRQTLSLLIFQKQEIQNHYEEEIQYLKSNVQLLANQNSVLKQRIRFIQRENQELTNQRDRNIQQLQEFRKILKLRSNLKQMLGQDNHNLLDRIKAPLRKQNDRQKFSYKNCQNIQARQRSYTCQNKKIIKSDKENINENFKQQFDRLYKQLSTESIKRQSDQQKQLFSKQNHFLDEKSLQQCQRTALNTRIVDNIESLLQTKKRDEIGSYQQRTLKFNQKDNKHIIVKNKWIRFKRDQTKNHFNDRLPQSLQKENHSSKNKIYVSNNKLIRYLKSTKINPIQLKNQDSEIQF